ncbi:hypothetical protein AWH62_06010 [Maricaulis sp. W15]|uniref:Uncharacterized protein n=1 Tax=Maricaulis maris TaxID=74318 RepID=A0A495D416_9PROT|nr:MULTISPECIES: hypothetical protein [Maricaulis]OLF75375.1 hypothetical protein AWH62_06010 [Maricaulis sp. W15]RKQ96663.1 hypothetical protein C7435_1996 [Maricaulis maris]
MAKAQFAISTLAKTALLWLTAALIFASLFGAMLSARPDRPGLSFSQSDSVIIASDADTVSETR